MANKMLDLNKSVYEPNGEREESKLVCSSEP